MRMKLAIIGSREFADYDKLKTEVLAHFSLDEIDSIISGGASGADTLGSQFAQENNIPLIVYRAEWEKYGITAGPRRNTLISNEADVVIAFLSGKSKGTQNTISKAHSKGKKVIIIEDIDRRNLI